VCLIFGCARTLDVSEPVPQLSKDGLQLQKQTTQRLVYLKPGAASPRSRAYPPACWSDSRTHNVHTARVTKQSGNDQPFHSGPSHAAECRPILAEPMEWLIAPGTACARNVTEMRSGTRSATGFAHGNSWSTSNLGRCDRIPSQTYDAVISSELPASAACGAATPRVIRGIRAGLQTQGGLLVHLTAEGRPRDTIKIRGALAGAVIAFAVGAATLGRDSQTPQTVPRSVRAHLKPIRRQSVARGCSPAQSRRPTGSWRRSRGGRLGCATCTPTSLQSYATNRLPQASSIERQ